MNPIKPVVDSQKQVSSSNAPDTPQSLQHGTDNKEIAAQAKSSRDTYESASPHRLRDRKEVEADAKKLGDAFVKQLRSNMTGWEPAKKEEWFTKEQLEGLKKMRDSI